MRELIYFDNSATTRISDEALATYIEVSRTEFGNPSSLHPLGHEAERQIRAAKDELRRAIGATDGEIIFTAGGTEANNLAILGRAYAKDRYRRGAKLLTSDGEHASVSEPLARLSREGFRILTVPTPGGVLDMDFLERELTSEVILVSIMAVNNETGASYDLHTIGKAVRARCPDALFHVDATQAFLKLPISVGRMGIDLLTVSSHKVEGPKGVGALYVSRRVLTSKGLTPCILGGGQEQGLRSGTENVPAIAAFSTACRIGREQMPERAAALCHLRAYLLSRLSETETLREVRPNLPPAAAPHIVNVTLPDIKSEVMLHFLSERGICVSSGSACSSHGKVGSPALLAFGLPASEADTSLRISLSHRNTEEECDRLIEALAEGVMRLSRMRRQGGRR